VHLCQVNMTQCKVNTALRPVGLCPLQVEHATMRFHSEADGSPCYPYLNLTEAVTMINAVVLRQSEESMDHQIRSCGGGPGTDRRPSCFVCSKRFKAAGLQAGTWRSNLLPCLLVCRSREGSLSLCPLCNRSHHLSCSSSRLAGTKVGRPQL